MAEAKINEHCFIGLPTCNYAFSSTRMAFIAAPSHESVQLEVKLLQSILQDKGIESYVALQNTEPAKFAFCTKICSKIITSQFCIALLTSCPAKSGSKARVANPNVHMEYGLMLALNKYVIPLQLEGDSLAFNVQPLDTVKYTKATFSDAAGEAIDTAILKTTRAEVSSSAQPITPLLLKYLTVRGLTISDVNRPDAQFWYRLGSSLGFIMLDGVGPLYLGIFDNDEPKEVVFRTKLLLQNLNQSLQRFLESPADTMSHEAATRLRSVYESVRVEVLVADDVDTKPVIEKISDLTKGYATFPWKLLKREDLQTAIDAEYKAIGEL